MTEEAAAVEKEAGEAETEEETEGADEEAEEGAKEEERVVGTAAGGWSAKTCSRRGW